MLRFGSGAGIVVEGADLVVYLARVRPGGATLLDTTRIADFRERPAADWGDEYNEMLRKHSLAHLAATVGMRSRFSASERSYWSAEPRLDGDRRG